MSQVEFTVFKHSLASVPPLVPVLTDTDLGRPWSASPVRIACQCLFGWKRKNNNNNNVISVFPPCPVRSFSLRCVLRLSSVPVPFQFSRSQFGTLFGTYNLHYDDLAVAVLCFRLARFALLACSAYSDYLPFQCPFNFPLYFHLKPPLQISF